MIAEKTWEQLERYAILRTGLLLLESRLHAVHVTTHDRVVIQEALSEFRRAVGVHVQVIEDDDSGAGKDTTV